MKKLIVLLIALLFVTGCVGYKYSHNIYLPDGTLIESYHLEANKAMVNDSKEKVVIELPDGSKLFVEDVNTLASPESMEAIGDAGAKWLKAYKSLDVNLNQ